MWTLGASWTRACLLFFLVCVSVTVGEGGASSADVEKYARLLENVWHYKPEFSKPILDMAIGQQGDRSRLERLFAKIIRGWNFADEMYMRQVHKWIEMTLVPGCIEEATKLKDVTISVSSGPAEGHEIVRGPNATYLHSRPSSSYRSTGHMCVLQKVPEDADLVIIDFGVNDVQQLDKLSHPERHAYERILRTILVMRNKPAILLFEVYSWNQALGSYTGGGTYGANLPQDKHFLIAEY
eukprot:gene30736-35772_t